MTALLAHLSLIFAGNVLAGRAPDAILLEPNPASVAVGDAIFRVAPEWRLLGLAGGAGLGLWGGLYFGAVSSRLLLDGLDEEVLVMVVVRVMRVRVWIGVE